MALRGPRLGPPCSCLSVSSALVGENISPRGARKWASSSLRGIPGVPGPESPLEVIKMGRSQKLGFQSCPLGVRVGVAQEQKRSSGVGVTS